MSIEFSQLTQPFRSGPVHPRSLCVGRTPNHILRRAAGCLQCSCYVDAAARLFDPNARDRLQEIFCNNAEPYHDLFEGIRPGHRVYGGTCRRHRPGYVSCCNYLERAQPISPSIECGPGDLRRNLIIEIIDYFAERVTDHDTMANCLWHEPLINSNVPAHVAVTLEKVAVVVGRCETFLHPSAWCMFRDSATTFGCYTSPLSSNHRVSGNNPRLKRPDLPNCLSIYWMSMQP